MRMPFLLATVSLFAACGDDHGPPAAGNAAGPATGAPVAGPVDGPVDGHVHGDRVALGAVAVGGHAISVFRVAPIAAGAEGDFDLDFQQAPLPGTVRGWVGIESGKGSRKTRFDKETATRMHGHPLVPDPIPPGSRMWIEIEGPDGMQRDSVPIDR